MDEAPARIGRRVVGTARNGGTSPSRASAAQVSSSPTTAPAAAKNPFDDDEPPKPAPSSSNPFDDDPEFPLHPSTSSSKKGSVKPRAIVHVEDEDDPEFPIHRPGTKGKKTVITNVNRETAAPRLKPEPTVDKPAPKVAIVRNAESAPPTAPVEAEKEAEVVPPPLPPRSLSRRIVEEAAEGLRAWPEARQSAEKFNALAVALDALSAENKPGQLRTRSVRELEAQCERMSQALDFLVKENQTGISAASQVHSAVLRNLSEMQQSIFEFRRDLLEAKRLLVTLLARRDELLQIWIKHLEAKEVISLLDRIDVVRRAPPAVVSHLEAKRYIQAASDIAAATKIGRAGELSDIGALDDLRKQLENLQTSVVDTVVDQLVRHLFLKSPSAIAQFENYQHQQQAASAAHAASPAPATTAASTGGPGVSETIAASEPLSHLGVRGHERAAILAAMDAARHASFGQDAVRSGVLAEAVANLEEPEVLEIPDADPEENSQYCITVLVDALARMRKLPAAVAAIQSAMQTEVFQLVERCIAIVQKAAERRSQETTMSNVDRLERRATASVAERRHNGRGTVGGIAGDRTRDRDAQMVVFVDLLETLFAHFKYICRLYQVYVTRVRVASKHYSIQLPDMPSTESLWSAIQDELRALYADYLQAPKPVLAMHHSTEVGPTSGKARLFRFADSTAASMRREAAVAGVRTLPKNAADAQIVDMFTGARTGAAGHLLLVEPLPSRIVALFARTEDFCDQVRDIMIEGAGKSTTVAIDDDDDLQVFLTDYVLESFLPLVKERVFRIMEAAINGPDMFLAETRAGLAGLRSRPLLKSALTLMFLIVELCKVTMAIPLHQDKYIMMVEMLLSEYYERCFREFRVIISGSGKAPLASCTWAYSRDLNALLAEMLRRVNEDQKLTPAEVDAFAERETKIENELRGDIDLTRDELLLSGQSTVQLLANLHYSLDWIVSQVVQLTTRLPLQDNSPMSLLLVEQGDASNVPRDLSAVRRVRLPQYADTDNAARFNGLLDRYRELSSLCIFLLRIELRCHCYYYLDLAVKGGDYAPADGAVEADPHILQVGSDILAFHDSMTKRLPPHLMEFVFAGLARLIADELIATARYLQRINPNGLVKMTRNIFLLQQTLASVLDDHNAHLDRARQYYSLLEYDAENLIGHINAHGAVFSLDEYRALLALINANAEALGHGGVPFGPLIDRQLGDLEVAVRATVARAR